jgi:hypothetical protein
MCYCVPVLVRGSCGVDTMSRLAWLCAGVCVGWWLGRRQDEPEEWDGLPWYDHNSKAWKDNEARRDAGKNWVHVVPTTDTERITWTSDDGTWHVTWT